MTKHIKIAIFTKIMVIAISLTTVSGFAQTPGNVGTANLTAWFKPDDLIIGDVTSWTTTYPTGIDEITVTDDLFPFPYATNVPVDNISNYNTTIEFEDNAWAALKGLENNGDFNLLDNSGVDDEGSFFTCYYKTVVGANDHMAVYNESGNDGLQVRTLGLNGRIAIGRSMGISINASNDWAEDFIPNIISYSGNRSGAATMDTYERSYEFEGGGASASSGPSGIYFGMKPATATSSYNGYLHEYIFFNRDLTDLEFDKVHTYLAVKYGVTLDNTGFGTQGDYIATNDDLIWDASVETTFHNDVIGIGRDDNEALYQKQSHAFDDSYRIYISDLAINNVSNVGVFDNDISYILFGQNLDDLCGGLEELPADLLFADRIEREWKVTKTNITQDFNWDLTLEPCEDIAGFDPSLIRLLVTEDDDFSDALSYGTVDGLTFSFVGNTLTVAGISDIHIPNNSTRFISIAYIAPEVTLTGDEGVCLGDSTELIFNFDVAFEPLDLILSDGADEIDLDGVLNGDGIYVSPDVLTTYTVSANPSPMACCDTPDLESGSITIDVWDLPIVNLGADTTICDGESLTLDAENPGATYEWNDASVDQTLTVDGAGEYHVLVTDDNMCVNADTIEVFIEIPLNPGNDSMITLCNSSGLYNLNDLLSMDADALGTWEETSISPSDSFDPVSGELDVFELEEGTYTFSYAVSGVFCGDFMAEFEVVVIPQPSAGTDGEVDLCTLDGNFDLNTLLSFGVSPGNWMETTDPESEQFNAVSGIFNPAGLSSGEYTFTYETEVVEPCPTEISTFTIHLTENPEVEFSVLEDEGCVPFTAYFTNETVVSGDATCEWLFGDGTISTSCGDVANTYEMDACYDVTLTVVDEGCSSSATYFEFVCAYPLPEAEFEPSPAIVFTNASGVDFINTSTDATSFEWDFGDGASSNEMNPRHEFPETTPGNYEVILYVTSDFGCVDETRRIVQVKEVQLFYVPNAFTPDGDGFNAIFKPIISAGIDIYDYHLAIYNRWGEIVYESYDPSGGWDGTYGGELMQDGIYIWAIEFGDLFSDKNYKHTGTVTLLH